LIGDARWRIVALRVSDMWTPLNLALFWGVFALAV